MHFVWVLSASASVCETEGERQAVVKWTFDEEESSWRTRRGREKELMKFMSSFSCHLSFVSSLYLCDHLV